MLVFSKNPKWMLNAKQTHQLLNCVKITIIYKQSKANKHCTKFLIVQCRSGVSGVDTMNTSTYSDFNKTSELLS